MNDFDIKRGHFKNLDGDGLKGILGEYFDDVKSDGDTLVASWGAMDRIIVVLDGKKNLKVETSMKSDVDDDTATETIRRYNSFMQAATGFNSKERVKRAKKKAGAEE